MTDLSRPRTMSDLIGPFLPYLRRYGRALTGSQDGGDAHAAATLEAILADPGCFDQSQGGKVGLFKVFHSIWASAGAPVPEEATGLHARAQMHLARLTPNTREALLLHTVEGFGLDEIGVIMGISGDEAQTLVDLARAEMQQSVQGRVMIIEDEAIIAMDLEGIVALMGHDVTGIARTRDTAVEMAARDRPDLILADIQLADNSSGIDAVNRILQDIDVPVIFITAFPERLLTGERPEPAFLIAKPYMPDQVISAVSQAMFFASTETLKA
ncbi:response regulator [Tropicimonas sp. IMCC34043]|uniref:response regulator n=1 Tax=Tropicimonas sp. IMCC34043 TaxID=2248760 RepID=UPI000E2738EC|nr:response regulator [Tropicimonas sp. IMCC34043]